MSLIELIDNTKTDKNTSHSYLDLQETLLQKKKQTAKHVLEIGIGDFDVKNGGSIKLWRDQFPNATIHALDILDMDRVLDELKNDTRVHLQTSVDAQNVDFFTNSIQNQKIQFDFLLDDGPHTIESMKQFLRLQSQVLAEDGILVIEDIRSLEWIDVLRQVVPKSLQPQIRVQDLRKNKGRFDDIVFTIDKTIVTQTPSEAQYASPPIPEPTV